MNRIIRDIADFEELNIPIFQPQHNTTSDTKPLLDTMITKIFDAIFAATMI